MPDANLVATHYSHGRLLDTIIAKLGKLGKTLDAVTVEDLGPVDEFHIGGRMATESFLGRINLKSEDLVLDVGCGLGGTSRFAAQRYGCRVTGIDLTQEYVETGRAMCTWVGLDHRISLQQGNATATPYPDNRFDKVYMLHVGMNIADKAALASELHRVLKPGGTLGIYDVMRVGPGSLTYPVPWATAPQGSDVGSPEEYKEALATAGFQITEERNRRDFALAFFDRLQATAAVADQPPQLGIHLLMGETAPTKIRNMVRSISENHLAPIELLAEAGAS